MIVVTAPGGGIHAAAWTAQVLAGLHQRYGDNFADHLKMVSSVSGGSIGTLIYLDQFQSMCDRLELDEKASLESDLESAVRRASASSLEAVTWGFAFPDTTRLLFPFAVWDDRGLAQERRFYDRLNASDDEENHAGSKPTLKELSDEAHKGKLPFVCFNATEAETGQRVLFSTIPLPPVAPQTNDARSRRIAEVSAKDFLSLSNGQFDLAAVTAARLSATFSFVSPPARPPGNAIPIGHIVDGGYVDNEGMLTAVDFIHRVTNVRKASLPKSNETPLSGEEDQPINHIFLIRIVHEPELSPEPVQGTALKSVRNNGWQYATLGPLMALANVRVASQAERAELELDFLRNGKDYQDPDEQQHPHSPQTEPQLTFREFVIRFPKECEQIVPLNWKLSPKQRVKYRQAWDLLEKKADRETLDNPDKKTLVNKDANHKEIKTKHKEVPEGLMKLDTYLKPRRRNH